MVICYQALCRGHFEENQGVLAKAIVGLGILLNQLGSVLDVAPPSDDIVTQKGELEDFVHALVQGVKHIFWTVENGRSRRQKGGARPPAKTKDIDIGIAKLAHRENQGVECNCV